MPTAATIEFMFNPPTPPGSVESWLSVALNVGLRGAFVLFLILFRIF